MKVVVLPSFQLYSGKDARRKWLLQDSQLRICFNLLRVLVEKTDWDITVVYQRFMEYPQNIIDTDRITWVDHGSIVDPVMQKYEFDSAFYTQILQQNFDIIITMNSEITRNLRALVSFLQLETKIIQFMTAISAPFLDQEETYEKRIDPLYRQIDGALAADLTVFSCVSLQQSFLENAWLLVGKYQMQIHSEVWDIGISMSELQALKRGKKQKPVIFFPYAIDKQNVTKWKEFIAGVEKLSKLEQHFHVVMANPTGVRWDWVKDNVPHIKVVKETPLTRAEYVKIMWESAIVVSLLSERYGGVENIEAMYCQALPLMPRIHEYAKRAPNDYPGFIRHVTPEEIRDGLLYLLCNREWIREKYIEEFVAIVLETSSCEANGKYIIDDMEKLVNI